jgi:chromate reductase, NAD(P)H dehydrogenase (quinone)
MKILAISGSLRASSSNTAMLRAAATLAPSAIELTLFDGIGNLPHFNPDTDGETVSPFVTDFRTALHTADAVIFSVPEYAHGVPGVLKNALDWVVGSGELAGKPVALFNPSARGAYAQASLSETLTVMAARLVPEAAVTLQAPGKPISEELILRDAEISAKLLIALEALLRSVETG